MHSLRTHVHQHISKTSLLMLIGSTLLALGFVGKSFTLLAGTSAEETAYVGMAVEHELPLPKPDPVITLSQTVPDRSFAPGENSPDVQTFQEFLMAAGFLASTTYANGYYGPETLEAAQAYQSSKGLPPIGIIGPETRAAWKADLK